MVSRQVHALQLTRLGFYNLEGKRCWKVTTSGLSECATDTVLTNASQPIHRTFVARQELLAVQWPCGRCCQPPGKPFFRWITSPVDKWLSWKSPEFPKQKDHSSLQVQLFFVGHQTPWPSQDGSCWASHSIEASSIQQYPAAKVIPKVQPNGERLMCRTRVAWHGNFRFELIGENIYIRLGNWFKWDLPKDWWWSGSTVYKWRIVRICIYKHIYLNPPPLHYFSPSAKNTKFQPLKLILAP